MVYKGVCRRYTGVFRVFASFGDRSFAAAAPRVCNGLPDAVRNSALSEDAFAKHDITYSFNRPTHDKTHDNTEMSDNKT